MLVADLLHSCANDFVAEAAVSSIGGALKDRMRAEASKKGVSIGFLAASVVRNFARVATEREWRDLSRATRGHDFPVLAGLEVILTRLPLSASSPDTGVRSRPVRHVLAAATACGEFVHACG